MTTSNDEQHMNASTVEPSRPSRRNLLAGVGGAGAAALLAGCTKKEINFWKYLAAVKAQQDAAGTTTTGSTATCAKIPEETAGPYPGDGSNGANVLTQAGIVRKDIRSSFGAYSGTATGVPLTITLQVVSLANSCAPLAGAAVYVWHCDINGSYSLYSNGITNQNYLRGVQETDADGRVSFTSIFPACYSGRWPHIHFEIYPSVAQATASGNKIATSQMALPQSACSTVYATSGYSQSVNNLSRITLASDNVFSDGSSLETPTVLGSVSEGYWALMTAAV